MTHDHTPRLPDIFPQGEINVDDEPHRYETFEGDAGDVLPKTEYTIDKAPIFEIIEVTGIYNGSTITFTNGTDYSLQDLVREQTDDFTFFEDDDPYTLTNEPDLSSTVVTDASGDSFTEDTDYEIINPDGIDRNTLRWLDGGSSPDDEEDFTVEYTVTFADSIIKWDTNERTPDAGSLFYISYRCDSVISRYIDGADEQLRTIEDELEKVIEGKFVDSAEGQELDEIGKLFGTLGKRNGRTDTQYRIFLKSVVQSFVSRGTVNGVKLAISAATDVPLDDITINEDFEQNEYEVVVIPQTPVDGKLLEEVAEIADPSGVEQLLTRFTPAPDEMQVNDIVSFTEGQTIDDSMFVSDAMATPRVDFFEDAEISDAVVIDGNKFTISVDVAGSDDEGVANRAEASDTLNVSDAFAIDPRTTNVTDETVDISETLNVEPSDKNAHEWEDDGEPSITGWNFFEWTEIIGLTASASDTVFADDSVTVPPKDAITSDSFFSADSVEVRFNVESVTDTAFTDDAVTIPPKDATTADVGGSSDTVSNVSETLVAWDTQDWGTLQWVQQHN